MNLVLENILSRRSIRSFVKGKKVPQQELENIVTAGMYAPTALNLQPVLFTVVTNTEKIQRLAKAIAKAMDRGEGYDFYAPEASFVAGLYLHRAMAGCIFQCVGYQILQYRLHFLLVYPCVLVVEVAVIGQPDVLGVGIVAEGIYQLLQVVVQFEFGNDESRVVESCPFEGDEVGGQSQQCIYVAQCGVYALFAFLGQWLVLLHLFKRCLDKSERCAYVVSGVDEELYLLFR